MVDKIKDIPKKILEWWNKFSTKQKMLIVSITTVIAIAMIIILRVLTTPTMVMVQECADTKEAGKVKELLDSEKIDFEVSSDGLVFKVKAQDEANAAILLGQNGIPAATYDLSNVFDGGFSTTEADKSKKYQLYLEKLVGAQLEELDLVEAATVKLNMPIDDGTILAQKQDTYAAVTLSLADEMTQEAADGLAKWIATAIGNDSTNDISIMDTAGNVLFTGGDESTSLGSASTQLSYKAKAENMFKDEVKTVLLGTNVYDNVSVGLNLVLDFDQEDVVNHNFYTPEGEEHGPLDSDSSYNSETTGGVAGAAPGTDANGNDNTTVVMPDGTNSSQTITDETRQFKTSEEITTTKSAMGNVDYETSSMSVVVNQYRIYNEDALKASGELDGQTFDEFVAANRDKVKLEVDPDDVQSVINATGFAEENINIVAYEVPFFEYSNNGAKGIMDYLPLMIAAVIMLLLGYVVFRSTRKEQMADMEPELSVESLLSSTKEAQDSLADIGFSDKSETRILIERFVEENPEAAASLLRNWLNEEWD